MDEHTTLERIITLKTNKAIFLAYAERSALLATTVAVPGSAEEDAYRTDAEFYRLAAEMTDMAAHDLIDPIKHALKEKKYD